jgi:type I restriction-modification system DNA methylase subunit
MTEKDSKSGKTNAPRNARNDSIYERFCGKFNTCQKKAQRSPRTLFEDFCLMTAAAFHNMNYSIGKPPPADYQEIYETLEQEYKETAKKYSKNVLEMFSDMVALLVVGAAEPPYCDHVGELYESLQLGSTSLGQIFTPMPICDIMGSVACGSKNEFLRICEEKGGCRVCDPACGSGRMVVALANVLKQDYGINDWRVKIYAELTDIDHTCVRMAYINMCLLDIPARVVWGDSLIRTIDRAYDTPFLQMAAAGGCLPPKGQNQNGNAGIGELRQLKLF